MTSTPWLNGAPSEFAYWGLESIMEALEPIMVLDNPPIISSLHFVEIFIDLSSGSNSAELNAC